MVRNPDRPHLWAASLFGAAMRRVVFADHWRDKLKKENETWSESVISKKMNIWGSWNLIFICTGLKAKLFCISFEQGTLQMLPGLWDKQFTVSVTVQSTFCLDLVSQHFPLSPVRDGPSWLVSTVVGAGVLQRRQSGAGCQVLPARPTALGIPGPHVVQPGSWAESQADFPSLRYFQEKKWGFESWYFPTQKKTAVSLLRGPKLGATRNHKYCSCEKPEVPHEEGLPQTV